MAQSLCGYAHYLNGLCAAGVNRFNHIFTSFYARQWYNVTDDVTRASLTVEDRLLLLGPVWRASG